MNCYIILSEIDSAAGNHVQSLADYKIYSRLKDSVMTTENNKQLADLQVRYETDRKNKEIEILNKDNSIKSLQLEQQLVSLHANALESEKNRNEILLLTTSRDYQQLQLDKTIQDLEHEKLTGEARAAELALISKDKEIKEEQLSRQKMVRNGMIVMFALLLLIGFLGIRSLNLRKKLEKQAAIISERKRIGADLHDDIGSGLSKISLLSEIVNKQIKSPEARNDMEKITSTSRELLDRMREIIWALNTNNDHLENLVSYIRWYASDYFELTGINLKMDEPLDIPDIPISGECRRNVFFSVKEAMHNIVKHSEATEAEIRFGLVKGTFSITVKDNGKGIPELKRNHLGNGLKNIMNRMATLKGNAIIESLAGTKIILVLPI
jgi:signal transduction histidine kinase